MRKRLQRLAVCAAQLIPPVLALVGISHLAGVI